MISSPAIGCLSFVVLVMLLMFHGSLLVGAVVYRDPFVMIAAQSGFMTHAMVVCLLATVATGVLLIPVMLLHLIRNCHLSIRRKLAWAFGIFAGYGIPFYWLRHVAESQTHPTTAD
jgi:hypothetical protein